MEFKTATDILTRRITAEEIAEAASVSTSTIARARLDRSSAAYRSPPPAWQSALLALAKKRVRELQVLIEALQTQT